MNLFFRVVIISQLAIASCTSPVENQKIQQKELEQPETTEALIQRDLSDSSKLTSISGQFYKSKGGHLYQRTSAQNDANGAESFYEYFNGQIPQDIDPLTFNELDGWYAKDKHFAYYYRPTSGGMLIVKLDKADVKSFKLLEGNYLYAVDKTHVFEDGHIVENVDPGKLKIIRGKHGEIVAVK